MTSLSGQNVVNKGNVNIVCLSRDGRYLATGGSDATVKIWEVSSGRLLHTLREYYLTIVNVSFSADNRYLAVGNEDGISVWEVSTGILLHSFEDDDWSITSMSFSEDGRFVALGSENETVKVWALSTDNLLYTLNGHGSSVESVSFTEDGQYLASGSSDKTVKIWELSTGHLLHTLEGHNRSVESVSFSGDGRYLASGSWDKTVRLWEVSTGRLLQTLKGHFPIDILRFSRDGQFLASASSIDYYCKVNIWNVSTGKLLNTLKGHRDKVLSLFISYDSRYILTSSWDNSVKIWEVNTGKCLLTMEIFNKAYIVTTPDGLYDGNEEGLKYLYYVKGGGIKVIPDFQLPNNANVNTSSQSLISKQGIKLIPRPTNDLNHVKGLMGKMLKGLMERLLNPKKVEYQTIIVPKAELYFIQPIQNIVTNTPHYNLKAFVSNIKEHPLSLHQNQKTIPYLLEEKLLTAKVNLMEGENSFTLQTEQKGEKIMENIVITYKKTQPTPHLRVGKDHALFFAVKDYKHWNDLQNPIRDADSIAVELKNKFGFDTQIIENPTKNDIYNELIKALTQDYKTDEQLLIYFSGHGQVNELNQGFFIPHDASKTDISSFYSYASIKEAISKSKCNHILLIIDACYSCSATNGFIPEKGKPDFKNHHPNAGNALQEYIKRKMEIESSIMINSGWVETSDGIEHSPMTIEILEILRNPHIYNGVIGVSDIISKMKKNAEQEGKEHPCFNTLAPKHKEGGEFLFISIKKQ